MSRETTETLEDVDTDLPYLFGDIEEALHHYESTVDEIEVAVKKRGSEKLQKEFAIFKNQFSNLRYASDEFADLTYQLEDEVELEQKGEEK